MDNILNILSNSEPNEINKFFLQNTKQWVKALPFIQKIRSNKSDKSIDIILKFRQVMIDLFNNDQINNKNNYKKTLNFIDKLIKIRDE